VDREVGLPIPETSAFGAHENISSDADEKKDDNSDL
jgi:hypothetical protein